MFCYHCWRHIYGAKSNRTIYRNNNTIFCCKYCFERYLFELWVDKSLFRNMRFTMGNGAKYRCNDCEVKFGYVEEFRFKNKKSKKDNSPDE